MLYHLKKLLLSFRKFRKSLANYPFRKFNLVGIFLFWIRERLTRMQFLVLSGVLVGLTAGLAGVLLKEVVHHIQIFITSDVPFEERLLIFAFLPMAGIVLTTLVIKYLFRGKDDREFSSILTDISKSRSKINPRKMYSQIIQSAITVSFGGSVGLETPNAITGSAIGSNYAQRYKLGFKERTLLLASGAAAGIASLFDAPIAGVMFAYEVVLTGLVFTDFIPLVIAAICGSLLSIILLEEGSLFHFPDREAFYYGNTLFYVVLGVLTGFYARYYLVLAQYVRKYAKRFNHKLILRSIIGGAMVSLLCVLFPPLYGEGYLSIHTLQEHDIYQLFHQSLFRYFGVSEGLIVIFLGLTVMLKALATSLTLNAGGSGGNFAPSLVSGGLLGYLFGFVLQMFGFTEIPIMNLMLVGMAGVMSGVWYAPLTGIFLIAEISSGYDLFIPLMVVSIIAFLINQFFSKVNPNYKDLAEKGAIFTTRQDQNLLVHIPLQDCMNPNTLAIEVSEPLDQVLAKARDSNQNTVAVVDEDGKFLGILDRVHLRPFLLNKKSTDEAKVSQLMSTPAFTITEDDSTMRVIQMFDEADVWQLPLLDDERKFQGFVSRSAILKNYRLLLREYSET